MRMKLGAPLVLAAAGLAHGQHLLIDCCHRAGHLFAGEQVIGAADRLPAQETHQLGMLVKMGEALSYAPALKQLGRTDTMKVVNGGIGIKKIFGSNGSSAGMVRVQIKSRPKGARITINGTVVDKNTPADLQLDPGTYEVVLEMLGYKPLHKIITVAGQKLQIDEELQQY